MRASPGQRMLVVLPLAAAASLIGFHPRRQLVTAGAVAFALIGIGVFSHRMRAPADGSLSRRAHVILLVGLVALITAEMLILDRGRDPEAAVTVVAAVTGMIGIILGRVRSQQ